MIKHDAKDLALKSDKVRCETPWKHKGKALEQPGRVLKVSRFTPGIPSWNSIY